LALTPIENGVYPSDAIYTRWYVTRGRLYTRRQMPRICHVCAKGPAFGHNRSYSMVATKRRFEPNLQRVRIDDHGTPRRVYVCTRCLKAGKVVKAR
jgi:large subunit ribosomal protein L28